MSEKTSVGSLTEVQNNSLCYVCSSRVGVSSRSSCDLFKEKTSLNETPPCYILSSIFNRQIDEKSTHSSSICRKCFKLCCEFENVEHRLLEIRLELIRQYNKTAEKFSLSPVELEDDEVDISFEESDMQTEQTSDEKISIKVDETPATLQENTEMIILQNVPMIEEYNDDNIEHLTEEDGNSNGATILPVQMTLEMKDEFFNEENMVEIVADDEGETYENIIIHPDNDGEISIVDEGSLDSNCIQMFGSTSTDSEHNENSQNPKHELSDSAGEVKLEATEDVDQVQPLKKKRTKTAKPADKDQSYKTEEVIAREGTEFWCLICKNEEIRFDNRMIGMHLKTAHDLKIFICDLCGEDFRKRSELTVHLDEHMNTTQDGFFTCEICKRDFHNLRLFRIHKKMHFSNTKTWECDQCNKKYGSKNLLDEHMNMHTGLRPYKCTVCFKDFASKYTLSAHMKIHSERPRPFECKTCNKTFYSGQNLFQHEKTHTGVKPFQCDVCDKTFSTQHNLEVHKIVHTGFKPFICRTCGKAFARRAEIKDHERIHTGEKPFSCDICQASFAQRSNLQSHKRATHFDDKRYQCEICDRRFKRRRLLDYHKKATHTGERPYKCRMCSSTFVYPEHYKKHLKIHTGVKPYACEICKKSFNSRDNRNAHRFIHSDKKPYECPVCNVGFMRKPHLFFHMKHASHLRDQIIVNQPRITSDGKLMNSMAETSEVVFKTEAVLIEKGENVEEELLDELIEGHIEDDEEFIDELEEEHLIVDGHVQLNGAGESSADGDDTVENANSEQILGTEDYGVGEDHVDDGEFFVTDEGQLYDTQDGTVRFIKINFDQNDKNGWMKIES